MPTSSRAHRRPPASTRHRELHDDALESILGDEVSSALAEPELDARERSGRGSPLRPRPRKTSLRAGRRASGEQDRRSSRRQRQLRPGA